VTSILKENVIALTGGIATGKTTVARFIAQQGFEVIDADQLARQVVLPGSPGLKALVEEFGGGILDPTGHLDRGKLRTHVFGGKDGSFARKKLEQITHPLIRQLLVKTVQEKLKTQDVSLPIFYEAALIFESGSHADFKEVWVTACHPETQLRRLMERNQWSREESLKFINAQIPMAEKMRLAHHVIRTDGTLEQDLRTLIPRLSALKCRP